MIAESHPAPHSTNHADRSRERLDAALAGVLETTGACHASALRYDVTRTQLVVAAVAGRRIIDVGRTRAAHEMDDVLADDPLAAGTPPAVEALAIAAGLHDTLTVPLRRDDGRVEGLLYVAWDGTSPVPAARAALGTVAWHLRHITRALFASDIELTRVVVAHEDELLADGVARRLERRWGFGLVTCSSLVELRTTLAPAPTDLVLCSDSLDPDQRLDELAALIRAAGADTRLVALTRTATPGSIAEAQSAQVDGLVALDGGAPELLSVVDAVARGATGVPPAPAVPDRGLSRREAQILHGLDEGLTYQAIATRLGVSVSTAKTQSRSLFRKLDVTSRGAAVHQARLEGLL